MASQNPSTKPGQRAETGTSRTEGLMDKAADTARDVAEQASDFADRAVEQGKEMGAMAQKAPDAIKEVVDTSLKQQPMMTLAVAATLGFVLGALWRS